MFQHYKSTKAKTKTNQQNGKRETFFKKVLK